MGVTMRILLPFHGLDPKNGAPETRGCEETTSYLTSKEKRLILASMERIEAITHCGGTFDTFVIAAVWVQAGGRVKHRGGSPERTLQRNIMPPA